MWFGRIKTGKPLESEAEDKSPIERGERGDCGNEGEENTDNAEERCSYSASGEVNCSAGISESWMVLSIAGDKPTPRFNHAATVVENKMIVVGGESALGLLDDVQVLDFDQFSWSTASSKRFLSQNSLPLKVPACKGHGLVSWGKKALLIGGKTDPQIDRISVWAFDTETECWSMIEAKGDLPSARSGHTLVRANSAVILFGGEDTKRRKLNDLHMLDLKTLTWLPLNCTGTSPSPRSHHVAALYQDKTLLIFGGSSKSRALNDLFTLDFETMVWSRVKPRGASPPPSSGCCGVMCGSKWYITGGGSWKKRHLDSYVYDVAKSEWSVAFSSPPSSITTNKHKEKDFLVAFGGLKKEASNQVEVMGMERVDEREGSRNFEAKGSSLESLSSIVKQTVSSYGSGRRKSLSESLLSESGHLSLQQQLYSEDEQSIGVKMVKILEDECTRSSGLEKRNITIGKLITEDTSGPIQPGSARYAAAAGAINEEEEEVPRGVYQAYEAKMAALLRRNGVLEGQLAAALANLEAAEKSVAVLMKGRQEMERKVAGTFREMELLKEKVVGLEVANEEATHESNIVHADNVRLEHDLAFLKAVLEDTQKELTSTRGVLAGERARAFQLQVEVFHAKQRLQTLESRVPSSRKHFQA